MTIVVSRSRAIPFAAGRHGHICIPRDFSSSRVTRWKKRGRGGGGKVWWNESRDKLLESLRNCTVGELIRATTRAWIVHPAICILFARYWFQLTLDKRDARRFSSVSNEDNRTTDTGVITHLSSGSLFVL